MSKSTVCYFNGDYIRFNDLKIHVSDLMFQRGYGIFDFFRTRNGQIPWLEDYMDRLFNSLELAALEILPNRNEFKEIIRELGQRNGLRNGAFKVIVTGGYSDSLDAVSGQANLIILNIPWMLPPEKSFIQGVSLLSYPFIRPNPEIKTLNYFNTLMLRKKMKEYNAVDILLHGDNISEASRANIFCIKNRTIYTPASNILPGITRKQVLSLIPEIILEDIPYSSLFEFDEVFITSTSRDVTPVVSVDGNKIGNGTPGKITREIIQQFRSKGF